MSTWKRPSTPGEWNDHFYVPNCDVRPSGADDLKLLGWTQTRQVHVTSDVINVRDLQEDPRHDTNALIHNIERTQDDADSVALTVLWTIGVSLAESAVPGDRPRSPVTTTLKTSDFYIVTAGCQTFTYLRQRQRRTFDVVRTLSTGFLKVANMDLLGSRRSFIVVDTFVTLGFSDGDDEFCADMKEIDTWKDCGFLGSMDN